ncbi:MAG: hypothetical protein U9R05_00695 [Chloroflexota bacterium]|nr:hypothetical protein [Chloroflexota bacterium]
MRRTIPTDGADEIQLYMRTYYSLLRTTEEVQIRTLEETHMGVHSTLHSHAAAQEPDMSAFIYSSLRLPPCIRQVRLVVLGQTEEVFQRRGYPNVETWETVSAPGRRRRMLYDGKETLAAFIASISDVDDVVPILIAFQIEWNKMNLLINRAGLNERLADWAKTGAAGPTLREELRQALRLSPAEWERLERAWKHELPALLHDIAGQHKRMAVRLLAGSYVDYRRATQRWWRHVTATAPLDLYKRAVYFVSSNTHSLVNMLTGFAQRHEETLLRYLETAADPQLRAEADRIRQGEVPSSWSNFLYYILKKYLSTPEGWPLLEERRAYELAHGITRIPSRQTFDLEAQVIELSRLNPEAVDSRLQDLPLARLAESQAVILNIDYPLGFAAYHLLSRVAASAGELRGLYVIGKAATLNARIGDVLIPNVIYDEHSRNTYLLNNIFRAADVAQYLVYGDVLDNQRAITVRGTFLQTESYMKGFLDAGYTDAEMEAGPYLSAAYEFIRPRRYPINELVNLYRSPFEIGILHYASDTPISKGQNLGTRNLSYYGMDPTYASTVTVLRRILTSCSRVVTLAVAD